MEFITIPVKSMCIPLLFNVGGAISNGEVINLIYCRIDLRLSGTDIY